MQRDQVEVDGVEVESDRVAVGHDPAAEHPAHVRQHDGQARAAPSGIELVGPQQLGELVE